MTWTDLTHNWETSYPRIKSRFPKVEESLAAASVLDRTRFVAYLADRHQISLEEAHQEFEDFLFVERLNRELSEGV